MFKMQSVKIFHIFEKKNGQKFNFPQTFPIFNRICMDYRDPIAWKTKFGTHSIAFVII